MKKIMTLIFTIALIPLSVASAMAFAAPAAGSFAYQIYEMGVVDIIQGPIGYVVAAGLGVVGAVMLATENAKGAIYSLAGAGIVGGVAGIVNSMGMIL